MGRWRGETFKEYVREQLSNFSEGMSRAMKKSFGFFNVEGGAFKDITKAVTTSVSPMEHRRHRREDRPREGVAVNESSGKPLLEKLANSFASIAFLFGERRNKSNAERRALAGDTGGWGCMLFRFIFHHQCGRMLHFHNNLQGQTGLNATMTMDWDL